MPFTQTLEISFPGLSAAEAGRGAAELEQEINQALREAHHPTVAKQHRTKPNSQDLGQVVQILLAAPASVVLARGIALGIQKYLARTNRGSLKVALPNGTFVEVNDVEGKDLAKVVDKLKLNALR